MDGTTDDLYLTWLYNQVGSVNNKNLSTSRWGLAKRMYRKPFVWLIPNDDNRVEDGLELRARFLNETGFDLDEDWLDLPCSTFEVLLALAEKACFQSDGVSTIDWFWKFVENIGLIHITDASFHPDEEELIDEVLDCVIFRNYEPDGRGGLFPLQHPDRDQRRVELWYQLSAYLLETQA